MVSETYEAELTLDVNTSIYLVKPAEKFTITLASSLGNESSGGYGKSKGSSLLDKYDYVMYGKIFSIKEDSNKMYESILNFIYKYILIYNFYSVIYASFGGLMMTLIGSQTDLDKLLLDMPIYLLMRRI